MTSSEAGNLVTTNDAMTSSEASNLVTTNDQQ
jgi:hypothetical protein